MNEIQSDMRYRVRLRDRETSMTVIQEGSDTLPPLVMFNDALGAYEADIVDDAETATSTDRGLVPVQIIESIGGQT